MRKIVSAVLGVVMLAAIAAAACGLLYSVGGLAGVVGTPSGPTVGDRMVDGLLLLWMGGTVGVVGGACAWFLGRSAVDAIMAPRDVTRDELSAIERELDKELGFVTPTDT